MVEVITKGEINIQKNLSSFELILIIMLSTGLLNHVFIIPVLLEIAGRDSWISIILAFFLYLIWMLLISSLMKKLNGEDIRIWLEKRNGKWLTKIFLSIIVILSLVLVTITMNETLTFTNFYLLITPRWVVTILLTSLCMYGSLKGLKSIAMISGILLPIVVLLGFLIMTANIPNKNLTLLKPFLEHGFTPVMKGTLYNLSGLMEVFFLLFIQDQVKNKLKISFFIKLGLILSILTFGPTIGAMTEFSPNKATLMRFPAYEEWRLFTLGRYIEHVDFLAVFQWLSGAYIRIAFFMYLAMNLLDFKKPLLKISYKAILILLIMVFSNLPITDDDYYTFMKKFVLPGTFYIILGLSLIFSLVAFLPKKEKIEQT
ncbi:endospore germination permease [Neobacillus vireti]|uniref:GerAB/ArcD/ProY family transporter n=1 Tax=Neobacillus vireti TaxID=220686 RepID=UPI002FFF651B